MFQSATKIVGSPLLDHVAMRAELALLAAGLDTRFVRVGETLVIAIETIGRVVSGLDAVLHALDPEQAGAAVADLRGAAARLADLPAEREAEAANNTAVGQTAGLLREQVMSMHQMLRVLSIYGMNIKIAASGEPSFIRFVEEMAIRLQAGEHELNGFLAKLKELAGGIAAARQADRLLTAECAKVIPHVPAQLALDACALEAHLQMVGEITHKVSVIARGVQARVATILGALQVGDRTRQRIEHVVAALQIVETSGAALGTGARSHIHGLLATQLDAASQDFTGETATMLASLGAIGPLVANLQALIGTQSEGDGRSFLGRLEEGLGHAERVTLQLRDADLQAGVMTRVIMDTVGELTGRLHSLKRIKLDVQDISTNTRLLCRGHGLTGKAVSVIATEVDAYAGRLGELTGQVARTICMLDTIKSRPIKAADSSDVGLVLVNALGVIRAACQRSDQVALQGGDDAQQLVDLLEQTGTELAAELPASAALDTVAGTLLASPGSHDPDASDAGVLCELLVQIGMLYTMAQEREIHSRFLLPGMEPFTTVSPADDEEDDGLF